MRIKTETRIEKCCGQKDSRYALNYVIYDGENLIATNGKILAVNPVEETDEHDTPGLIPVDAIKQARNSKNIRKGYRNAALKGHLFCHEKFHFPDKDIEYKRPKNVEPVKWQRIVDDVKENRFIIALDADFLKTLADAICSKGKGVKLFIGKDPLQAVRVEPLNENGCYGIIMPMRALGMT